MKPKEMPFLDHLTELRKVILVSAGGVVFCSFLIFFTFSDRIFLSLTAPLKELSVPVIAIRVGEAFFIKIKISLMAGFFMAFPLTAWQALGFVMPALTKQEKRMLPVLFPLSLLLFAGGIAFAYLTVFPVTVRFLLLVASEGLTPMISIHEYLSFVILFFIPFGVLFQLPLAVYTLCKLGLVTSRWLSARRKYAVLTVFILAAVLTPGTDVFSQIMMAVPAVLLYEASIIIARLVQWRESKKVSKQIQ